MQVRCLGGAVSEKPCNFHESLDGTVRILESGNALSGIQLTAPARLVLVVAHAPKQTARIALRADPLLGGQPVALRARHRVAVLAHVARVVALGRLAVAKVARNGRVAARRRVLAEVDELPRAPVSAGERAAGGGGGTSWKLRNLAFASVTAAASAAPVRRASSRSRYRFLSRASRL